MKKRSDGLYQKSVCIGFDSMGNKKRKVIYAKTQRELSRKEMELKIKCGTSISGSDLSDCKFIQLYEMWMSSAYISYSPNTIRSVKSIMKHVSPIYGMNISDILPANIISCVSTIEKKPLRDAVIKWTRIVFTYAIENRMLTFNPCLNIKSDYVYIPKKVNVSKKDFDKILKICANEEQKMFVNILYYTGMRISEIFALNESDFKDNYIEVSKQLYDENGEAKIKILKTTSAYRVIPYVGPMKAVFDDFKANSMSCDKLFHREGKYLRTGQIGAICSRLKRMYLRAYGEELIITPHSFRHNMATNMIYSGADIVTSAKMLGHKSTKMLTEIYASSKQDINDVSKKLSKALK